jgi:alanine racemase
MRYSDSGKAHTIAEINLSALLFNLMQVRRSIDQGCQVLAVVKANAYGHGAIPVARALSSSKISMLGVAWVHEGIELRKAGIRLPILVMGGPTQKEADEVLSNRLTPVVFRPDQVITLEKIAKKKNRKARIHIKIDSGMGRLGVSSKKELLDLLGVLRRAPHLVVEGVMSHMAEDGLDQRFFTKQQLTFFQQALDLLAEQGVPISLRHVANSSITIDLKSAHFNMVRPGIMLYGYRPTKNLERSIELKPVMTLKTKIIHLKRVPSGTSISYGRTYMTDRETLIGTLPVGYADGIPRSLSNQGEVLVGSKRARVIGRVCMDMMMIDLTGWEDVKIGQEVILIGQQNHEMITADDLAEKTGTISYEILCGIGSRVSRVYIRDPRAKGARRES